MIKSYQAIKQVVNSVVTPVYVSVAIQFTSIASSDFKPKRSSHDKKPPQGRVTPLVGDHKVDHGYIQKTSTSKFSSPTELQQNSDIKFYNQYERYYEFTNFSSYPIKLDGKEWPTTEHYFQAQKFIGTPYAEAIRKQRYPRGAFDMSRNPGVSRWKRGDWDQVKDDIMLKCLRAKFTQHKDLKKMLLDTGERNLIEHTFNDSYWGDGGDGSGQNKLGKLLMQVRKELSKQTHERKFTSQSSSFHGILGRESHGKKKHRRHNSISGITVPGLCGSHTTLISGKRKFKSTENLSASTSSNTQSSSQTLQRRYSQQYGGLLASDRHTLLKPTVTRSSSHGDLSQPSSISYLTKKLNININKSSVSYDIISNK